MLTLIIALLGVLAGPSLSADVAIPAYALTSESDEFHLDFDRVFFDSGIKDGPRMPTYTTDTEALHFLARQAKRDAEYHYIRYYTVSPDGGTTKYDIPHIAILDYYSSAADTLTVVNGWDTVPAPGNSPTLRGVTATNAGGTKLGFVGLTRTKIFNYFRLLPKYTKYADISLPSSYTFDHNAIFSASHAFVGDSQTFAEIFVAATYQRGDYQDSSFVFWKYNTRFNITEFVRVGPTDLESHTTPYEKVVSVNYDAINSQAIVGLKVKQDQYLGAMPYDIGAKAQPSGNINIAFAAFDATYGHLKWTQLLGCTSEKDELRGFELFGSHAYILTNCEGSGFAIYQLNTYNGQILNSHTFYTPTANKALSLSQAKNGLYAYIYVESRLVDSVGGNNYDVAAKSTVLVHFDLRDLSVISIGHAPAISDEESQLPAIVHHRYVDSTIQTFVVRHSNNGNRTALHFSKFADDALTTNSGCGGNCALCSNLSPASYCEMCSPSFFLSHGICAASAISFTANGPVYADATSGSLLPCYYSCERCSGGARNQCTQCLAGTSLTLNVNTCECSSNFENNASASKCDADCPSQFGSKFAKECRSTCPDNTYADYSFSTAGVFSPPGSITSNSGGCLGVDHSTTVPVLLDAPLKSSFPKLFTMNLWLKVTAKATNAIYISGYGVFYLKEGASGGVKYEFKQDVASGSATISASTLASNTWSFFSISAKTLTSSMQFSSAYCSPCVSTLTAGGAITGLSPAATTISSRVIIGAAAVTDTASTFTGIVSELRIFSAYHSLAYVQSYFASRTPSGASDLIAYWRFNEDPTASSNVFFADSSPSQYLHNMTSSQSSKVACVTPLTQTVRPQAICTGFVPYTPNTGILTESHLKRFTLAPITYESSENLHLYPDALSITDGSDKLSVYSSHVHCASQSSPVVQYTWTANALTPVVGADIFSTKLSAGNYYTLCVELASGNQYPTSKFYVGQIFIATPPTTFLPPNKYTEEGMNTRIYFFVIGGDSSFHDKIYFHESCSISASALPADTTAVIRSESTGEIVRKNIDDFRISGKKAFQCFSPSYAPDEFARIGEFFWIFSKTPLIFGSASVKYNAEFFDFSLVGSTLQDYDRVGFMIRVTGLTTCQNSLLLPTDNYGVNRVFGKFPLVWFGSSSGMHFTDSSASVNVMACYRSSTLNMAPPWWTLNTSGLTFLLTITGVNTNSALTEIMSISPAHGELVTDTATRVKFIMKGSVKPSKGPSHNGYVKIIKATLSSSGDFTPSTNGADVVWTESFTSTSHGWTVGKLQGVVTGGNTEFTLSSTLDYLSIENGYFFCTVAHSFRDSSTGALFMEPNTSNAQVCPYFFYVSDATITTSALPIPSNINTFTIQGTNLLTSASGTFTTTRVDVSFDVHFANGTQACGTDVLKHPSAYFDTITNTAITSTSTFKMGVCEYGELIANVTLTRNQAGSYEHQLHFLNVKVGELGCDASCFSCNGRTASECVMCPTGTIFNTDGVCGTTCTDPAKPYYREISDANAPTAPRTYECLAACPSQYNLDTRTNECMACSETCDECTSFVPNSCVNCQPGNFFFNGTCIPNCPTPVYTNNFETYECQLDNATYPSPIGVFILPLIYEQRQAKNRQYYFEAMITQNRTADLVSVQWSQILPEYDTSVTSNYIIEPVASPDLMAKANMNAFNSYSESQSYVVKVVVTDALGNKGAAVKQFFMNEPPKTTSVVVFPATSVTPLDAGTGATFEFILQDWYNEIDDPDFELDVAVYYKLINKNVYYMIRPYNNTVSFKFEMPFVYFATEIPLAGGGSTEVFNMQIFVTTLDNHGARTTQTARVDVRNSYSADQRESTLLSLAAKNLTFVGDLLYVLNTCEAILQKEVTSNEKSSQISRRAVFVHLPCSSSFHCTYGICNLQHGFCQCETGYAGQNCDWRPTELVAINTYAQAAAEYLNATYNITGMQAGNATSYVNSKHQELIFTVIKHALKIPEAIAEVVLYTFIDYVVEIVKDGETQLTVATAGQMLSQDLQRITEAISRCMEVLFVLMRQVRVTTVKARAEGDPDLATVVAAEEAKQIEYAQKMAQLENALNICFNVFARLLTKQEYSLRYTTNLFSFQLTKALPADLYGQRALLFDGDTAKHYIHPQLFKSSVDLPDENTFLIQEMLHWVADPKSLNSSNILVETSVSEYTLRDPDTKPINITLSAVPIDIFLPFSITPGPHDALRLKCHYYDTANDEWSQNGCVTLQVSESGVHCRCNHLSKFAGVVSTGVDSIAKLMNPGLYADYNGFLFWQASLATMVVAVMVVLYVIMFPCFMFCERKKLAKLRKIISDELDQLKHPSAANQEKDYRSVAQLEMGRLGKKDNNTSSWTPGKKKGFNLDDQLTERKPDKFKGKKGMKELPATPSDMSGYLVEENSRKEGSLTPRVVPNLIKKQSRKKAIPPSSLMDETVDKSSLDISIASNHQLNRSRDQDSAFGALRAKEVKMPKQRRSSKKQEILGRITPSKDIINDLGGKEEMLEDENMGARAHEGIDSVSLEKERRRFLFWAQMKSASPVLNTLLVTSLMLPRHVRFTMLFCQVVLNMFGCAIYFANVERRLEIPEELPRFHMMTSASIGIGFLVPVFTDIAVYFVAGLFRISEGRFRNVETSDDYQVMLRELRKETFLRYIMAYFVVFAGASAMLWYIIRISSMYGWLASSKWLWGSIVSLLVDFIMYEILFAVTLVLIYKCNRRFGVWLDKVRRFRQAVPEE